jgi:hypothetical protein
VISRYVFRRSRAQTDDVVARREGSHRWREVGHQNGSLCEEREVQIRRLRDSKDAITIVKQSLGTISRLFSLPIPSFDDTTVSFAGTPTTPKLN